MHAVSRTRSSGSSFYSGFRLSSVELYRIFLLFCRMSLVTHIKPPRTHSGVKTRRQGPLRAILEASYHTLHVRVKNCGEGNSK